MTNRSDIDVDLAEQIDRICEETGSSFDVAPNDVVRLALHVRHGWSPTAEPSNGHEKASTDSSGIFIVRNSIDLVRWKHGDDQDQRST